ncbi:MAG: response regulator, partial [Chloroflexi bacterium]|nr:response regulator [Chloroflexota bacterium]
AAVGQLAAGIAHDFNNILTGIIGLAQLMQLRQELSPATRADLDRIVREGYRAAHLIRQILDFSRTSSRAPQLLDLVPLLKEMVKFLARTIPEHIRLDLEIDPGEHQVYADLTQIQQVVTNLAVNARDAMPQGGDLVVRLSRLVLPPGDHPPCADLAPGEWVVLSIRDTGTGIPPEIMARIFEPFFTTKEVGQGSGLGLAQVYGIVKQHNGYIDVVSQVGEGTIFFIYLPAAPTGAVIAPAAPQEPVPPGQGELILLVEDDATVREVVQAGLQQLGYRVLTAANGQEARQVYEQRQDEIALVLTDLLMPIMDGLALCESLRALDPAVKVVMITGHPLGDGEQLLVQGIAGWIQKPPDQAQLAQVLQQALGGNGDD